MGTVSKSVEIPAPRQEVWDTVTDPGRFGDWQTIHVGFAGDPPEQLSEGAEFKQKVTIMGMPGEIAWTGDGLRESEQLPMNGAGPMGTKATATFSLEDAERGDQVHLRKRLRGRGAGAARGRPGATVGEGGRRVAREAEGAGVLSAFDPQRLRQGAARLGGRAAVEMHAVRQIARAGMVGAEPPWRTAAIVARAGPLRPARRRGSARPAIRHGDATGLVDELGELSFAELDRRSNALANAWRAAGMRRRRRGRDPAAATTAASSTRRSPARKLGAPRALPEHRLRRPAGARGVRARGHRGARLRRGVRRGGRRRRGAARPVRRLGRRATATTPTLEELIAAGDSAPPPKPAETLARS